MPPEPEQRSVEGDVESPCIDVCMIDRRNGLCRGCYRSLAEISQWMSYSRSQKLALLQTLQERKRAAGAQTGCYERTRSS